MALGSLSTGPVIPRYEPPAGFDSEALTRITGGNTSLAEELITMLLIELPDHKADLQSAHAENNLEQVAAVSHTLCGGAAYCGALRLKELSRTLEDAARTGNENRIDTALIELETEIEQLLASAG